MKILIADAFDKALPDKLLPFGQVTEDKEQLKTVDVVLVRSATKCTKEYIDSAPNLKLIIRGGVGTDNIDVQYAQSKAIQVRNTPRASAVSVAELAFALMLAAPNHLIRAHRGMVEGKFLKKEIKRTELFGKRLCIVGLGNIGGEFAKRAQAFGMRIAAYDITGKNPFDFVELKPTLASALDQAQYASLHVPLTEQSRGMIHSAMLEHMADGAVLINTARDGCIVAADVAAALHSGKLSAYATDVWPSDPPPSDWPLLKAPNVIMTPHIGASTSENLGRIGEEVVSILGGFKQL